MATHRMKDFENLWHVDPAMNRDIFADDAAHPIDFIYWHHGSVALRQVGGDTWRRWKAALLTTLPPHQNPAGCRRGSWDPIGPWGREGSRVYSTAMGALALQAEGRYGRLFGED